MSEKEIVKTFKKYSSNVNDLNKANTEVNEQSFIRILNCVYLVVQELYDSSKVDLVEKIKEMVENNNIATYLGLGGAILDLFKDSDFSTEENIAKFVMHEEALRSKKSRLFACC